MRQHTYRRKLERALRDQTERVRELEEAIIALTILLRKMRHV
jgi:hypothetical protein